MFKQVTLGALVLSFLILGTFVSWRFVEQVNADTSASLSGFAWSSNIGWISLDCNNTGTNKCATGTYGVKMDKTTNDLTGFAWSPNIGWIDFAPVGPYPTGAGAGNHSARFDPVNKKLTGWVRAVAQGGGWDGWISLSGGAPASAYGITLGTDNKFSGFSWGDEVVGWVTLAYASCADCVTVLPQVDNILTVTIAGSGSGNVVSDDSNIRCGQGITILGNPYTGPQDCSENYGGGAAETVTLTASALSGSTFAGWQGALCTGGTCQVTVNQSKTVTATFNTTSTVPDDPSDPPDGPSDPIDHTLNVNVVGSGKVAGSGIDCGVGTTGDCVQTSGSSNITLIATPVDGANFIGWSDSANSSITGCREICAIPLDQSKTVTATFSAVTPPEVISPVIFGACTKVGGICTIKIDCVTSGCRSAVVGSDTLAVNVPTVPEGGVAPDIQVYFGNSAGTPVGTMGNFDIQQCTSTGNCSSLGQSGIVSGASNFTIKVVEQLGLETAQSSVNTYLWFDNGVKVKALFRFITSNAGQN